MGTDNVADGFYPYGSYDLLDSYALGVQAAHLSPADAWLASVTTAPASAMGLSWGGKIAVGCPADLVLLAARTPYELITPAGRLRRVMRAGQFLTF
jgi:cytosine deaminase